MNLRKVHLKTRIGYLSPFGRLLTACGKNVRPKYFVKGSNYFIFKLMPLEFLAIFCLNIQDTKALPSNG